MKKIKFILKILSWPFDHLVEIGITSVIIFIISFFEVHIFNIPEYFVSKIWLSNVILTLIIYFYSKSTNTKEYKETLEYLKYGFPTKEESIQYKNEFEEIGNKYSGKERFNKEREFIIRKRMENTLKINNLGEA